MIQTETIQNERGELPIKRFTFGNEQGTEVTLLNIGAVIQKLYVADRHGMRADIVHGFDQSEAYLDNRNYFGAVVGRFGNRIANGRFTLEGQTYQLDQNDGLNHLHGGVDGYHQRIWNSEVLDDHSVRFSLHSPDGDQGYPGALVLNVTYRLTDNELSIQYEAEADQTTIINPTQHSYFNLSGNPQQSIDDHQVRFACDRYVPVNSDLIPLGQLAPVQGTPFDLQQTVALESRLTDSDEQLRRAGGFDHALVFSAERDPLQADIEIRHPGSGRTLQVYTDQPSVQFYSGNFLAGDVTGKSGVAYPYRSAFCVETQHLPDSPNQPEFPTTQLNAGQRWQSVTRFCFSAH